MMLLLFAALLLAGAAFLGITMPTNAPGNLGANLWDQSNQGSDHTHQPGQPPMIPGGPQNVIFADAGTLCSDETGQLWIKTSDRTAPTGWQTIASSPPVG